MRFMESLSKPIHSSFPLTGSCKRLETNRDKTNMKKTLLSIGLALVAGITAQAGVHKYQNGTYSKSYSDGSVITLTPRFGGGFNIYQAGLGYTSYGVAIPRWDGGYKVYKNMNGRVFFSLFYPR